MITTIMAAFAFGYCVTDIVLSYRAKKKLNQILKEAIERETN